MMSTRNRRNLARCTTTPCARREAAPRGPYVTYDPEARAGYVYLLRGHRGVRFVSGVSVLDGAVNIDFDERGRILGLEILDPALLHEETIGASVPPGE